MKIACRDLVSLLSDNPSVSEVSENFFSWDMSMKLMENFLNLSSLQTEVTVSH